MTGRAAGRRRGQARARFQGVTLVLVGMVVSGSAVGMAMSGGPGEDPAAATSAPVASADAGPTRPTVQSEQATPTVTDPATVAPPPAPPPSSPVAPVPVPPPAEPQPTPPADVWVVVDVIDGDTVDARRDGVVERVRVVGLDTPEQGQCGFEEAARALTFLALDRQVLLTPGARDGRDRYDRLLAYVDVVEDARSGATLDAGLSLITDGYGIARYDSRDGYGTHAREAEYLVADAASPPRIDCGAAPAPQVAPAPAPAGPGAAGCDAAYPEACIPQAPPDLDCGDVPHRRFAVLAPDPHRFDADGDGRGCTSG